MTVAARLGQWIAEARLDSPPARGHAEAALVDTLGCMIAGLDESASTTVRSAIETWGDGPAWVVGAARRAPAPWAALANGTAAHALDFDDHEDLGFTHPSAVLVPALLALGEERDASGAAVIDGYVAGYEAIARVGAPMIRDHYDRGWHATSTIGAIGAAAACARLLRLDAARATNAVSLAASAAGGTRAQFGTMAKPMHAGLGAMGGVVAATLAANGVTAAPGAIDGVRGLAELTSNATAAGFAASLDRLGAPLALESDPPSIKRYPCCAAAHRALDGLLELRERHGFAAGDVRAIVATLPMVSAQNVGIREPADEMEARFSLAYCAAAALERGTLALADFAPSAIRREPVRALARRLSIRTMEKRAPVVVEVELDDGRRLESSVAVAVGHPSRPLPPEALRAKFHDCVAGRVAPAAAADLLDALLAVDRAPAIAAPLRGIADALAGGAKLRRRG